MFFCVRAVNNNGILNNNNCNNDGGVRPFWWEVSQSRHYAKIRAPHQKNTQPFP